MSVSIVEYQHVNYWYLRDVVLIVLCVLEIMEYVCVIYLQCVKIYNSEEESHVIVVYR
jgi:hypothetical protein